jgi:AcrR family transcriptional regulator
MMVADLAMAIGVPAAHVYRFFKSKQAIGETVCTMTLARIDDELLALASDSKCTAASRLRGLSKWPCRAGYRARFNERKLHDLVVVAVENRRSSVMRHKTSCSRPPNSSSPVARPASSSARRRPRVTPKRVTPNRLLADSPAGDT